MNGGHISSYKVKEERPVWFKRFVSRFVAEISRRPEFGGHLFAEFLDQQILALVKIHSVHTFSFDPDTATGTQYRHVLSIDVGAFCADLALAALEYSAGKLDSVE